MRESPEIIAFFSNQGRAAAEVRLYQVQQDCEQFAALNDLYPDALESLKWCYHADQYEEVLHFATALKKFLHLQGHWDHAKKISHYALRAIKQLQKAANSTREIYSSPSFIRSSEMRRLIVERASWAFYAGLIQDEQSEYRQAERYYRQSLILAHVEKDLVIQANVWRRLGWLAHAQGDQVDAEACYWQAEGLHRYAYDDAGRARTWRQLGILAMEANDYDRARERLQASLNMIKGNTDREAQQLRAAVYLDLGRIALKCSYFNEVESLLNCALTYSEEAQDYQLHSQIYYYLAQLAKKQGDFQKAIEQYKFSRDVARRIGDRRGLTSALIALGTLALQKSDYIQAERYYEKVKKYILKSDRRNQAVLLAQLGRLAYLQREYELAQDYLQRALNNFCELNSASEIANCHLQLGLIDQARQQWRKTEEHYQTSLKIRQELNLLPEVVESLHRLGILAYQLNKLEAAQIYCQQALELGEQVGYSDIQLILRALEKISVKRKQNSSKISKGS